MSIEAAPVYYWVYILLCANNSLYTGYTTAMGRRYADHVAGKCKYTRSFKPVAIARAWRVCGTKSQAMHVERYIKKLARPEKESLILRPGLLCEQYAQEVLLIVETENSPAITK